MSKLTKEQIEKIKRLRNEGMSIRGIAHKFNVAEFTIFWHTNPHFKERIRIYQRERYRRMTKAQKKIYALRAEKETEEIHSRYLKLDLNNAQVKVEELQQSEKNLSREIFRSRVENWFSRALVVLYLMYNFWLLVHG